MQQIYPIVLSYISRAQWLTIPCLCLCRKFSYHLIFFARLWMGVGAPGGQKSIFGYRFVIGLAEVPRCGKFWQLDMCSPGGMLPQIFDAAGCINFGSSLYRFIYMVLRHKHQRRPHMKGFLHEHFCLLPIYILACVPPRALVSVPTT